MKDQIIDTLFSIALAVMIVALLCCLGVRCQVSIGTSASTESIPE